MQLALDNAQEKPDVIYLTGGSARSPLIKRWQNSCRAFRLQAAAMTVVTAGLARWAEVVFR